MIEPHDGLTMLTPDEFAETVDGVFDAGDLYERLWSMTKHYKEIDREDCGPADVIGINSIASFWDKFTEEEQVKLNEIMAAHDAYIASLGLR